MDEQEQVQEMTDEEKEGVKAIVFLQSLVGIVEPEDKALRGWRGFSEYDKEATLRMYTFCENVERVINADGAAVIVKKDEVKE